MVAVVVLMFSVVVMFIDHLSLSWLRLLMFSASQVGRGPEGGSLGLGSFFSRRSSGPLRGRHRRGAAIPTGTDSSPTPSYMATSPSYTSSCHLFSSPFPSILDAFPHLLGVWFILSLCALARSCSLNGQDRSLTPSFTPPSREEASHMLKFHVSRPPPPIARTVGQKPS